MAAADDAPVDLYIAAYPDPDAIIERNLATMQRLGADGYRALLD